MRPIFGRARDDGVAHRFPATLSSTPAVHCAVHDEMHRMGVENKTQQNKTKQNEREQKRNENETKQNGIAALACSNEKGITSARAASSLVNASRAKPRIVWGGDEGGGGGGGGGARGAHVFLTTGGPVGGAPVPLVWFGLV